ncbi:MAG: hypothetical protein WA085_13305 [Sphingobium sp.]
MPNNETARKFVAKNESVILRAIADATQGKVAEAMGDHKSSYVSTFLSGTQKISFEEMLALLDAAGLVLYRGTDDLVIVEIDDWSSTVKYAKKYWQERSVP